MLDSINLNSLRIFEAVYRLGNMTLAANELALTQSGVSQHVANLEVSLDIKLFERVHKRIFPTKEAELFYAKCRSILFDLEATIVSMGSDNTAFEGQINLGLPIEFGNNLVLPLLSKIRKQMPGITFKIHYGHALEMNELLSQGSIDFAFVDTYRLNKLLKMKKVYEEELVLCCSKEYFKSIGRKKQDKKFFENLDYVAYLDEAPVVKNWLLQKFKFQKLIPRIASRSMDVQGVATLIANDVGVGVLPMHAFRKYADEKTPFVILGDSSNKVMNAISLAYHPARYESPIVKFLIDSLLEGFESRA